MKLDTSLWNNLGRARIRIKNLATMLLTLAIINLYNVIATKNWILVAINIIYALTTLPVFLSYGKWQKEPPKEEENESEDKS